MIKAVLIDDEKDARFLLRNIIETLYQKDIEIVGEGDDVDTGLHAIRECKPDIVFLDIQMPQGTGFDLLEKVDEIDFEVVFVTAYNNYAVKAFQCSAFGYLMKPIKSKELENVIENLKTKLEQRKEDSDKRLKVLIDNFLEEGKIKKIIISNMEGFKVIELADIYYLEGDRNYTNFILKDQQKITATKTMGEYDDLLSEHGFFRVHQSYLVNLTYVKEYLKGDGGSVVMKDGTTLKVARNRKQDFISQFL